MSFFVTGTDTDVGKTYVTALILRGLRARGVDAVGYKPVSCGNRDDARVLAAASGDSEPLDAINPVWYDTPVAPYVAGIVENRPLEVDQLVAGYEALAARHAHVLVEGAGGWEVPLAPGFAISDLARALRLPVLLVVSNKLGALNHSVLTLNAIRHAGLHCAGVVFNNLQDELDVAAITNLRILQELTGVQVLADVIRGEEELEIEPFLELL